MAALQYLAKQSVDFRTNIGAEQDLNRDPANRLMLAVLEDALATFERGVSSAIPEQRQRFCEVDRWVNSADTDWPFSFENICSVLLLDPAYIRCGLKRLKRGKLMRSVPASDCSQSRKLRRERIYDRRAWRGRIS